MPRDKRKVESALTSKGFQKAEGNHHYFWYRSLEGKKTDIFTKTSHSGKEISKPLLGRMAKQCRIGMADLYALVDCSMDQIAYEKAALGPPPDAKDKSHDEWSH